jgi:hypothetical protein
MWKNRASGTTCASAVTSTSKTTISTNATMGSGGANAGIDAAAKIEVRHSRTHDGNNVSGPGFNHSDSVVLDRRVGWQLFAHK